MEIKEIQQKSIEILENINKKFEIKHEPEKIFLSLVEEVGEVARELSKKQKNFREEFDKIKLGEELADIITRVTIIAEDNQIDLEQAITNKFNELNKRFELE